jgi:hypothetical protein
MKPALSFVGMASLPSDSANRLREAVAHQAAAHHSHPPDLH